MNKPHKHAEVIKAWADGAEIEVNTGNSNHWQTTTEPCWYEDLKYRVKPKPHKHQGMIDAYNRGEEIQYLDSFNKWCDFNKSIGHIPSWYEHDQYRVKPKGPKTVVKYLWSTPQGVVTSVLMSEDQKKSTSSYDDYSVKLEWSRTEFKE